ncbi:hypothetical protein KIPB_010677 [Kipferlia bialata]|uniref:Uncharacterized protein n=1 Tax=Kipferlia bialata TaxID=797122 RepID=A0A9K3D4W6_9EUKA|nr:hypothetical protein KIPB_010677 [Kipferlia bialata]|eukprot:g10677.t1
MDPVRQEHYMKVIELLTSGGAIPTGQAMQDAMKPDPGLFNAKRTLAIRTCRDAQPRVQAELQGVADVPPFNGSYALRMWLVLPENLERRGVSLSWCPMMEAGLGGSGKGPGCSMVETALIGPDNQLLYNNEFGYSDVLVHSTLDECVQHIKDLRTFYLDGGQLKTGRRDPSRQGEGGEGEEDAAGYLSAVDPDDLIRMRQIRENMCATT